MPRAGEDHWHPACERVSSLGLAARPYCRGAFRQPGRPAEGDAAAGAIGGELIERGDRNPLLLRSASAWALPMSPAPLWTSGPPKSGQATAVRD